TSSGMAAIDLLVGRLRPDDCVLAPHDCYGGTMRLLKAREQLGQVSLRLVDQRDGDAVAVAIQSFTMPGRLEWIAGRPPTLIDGAHNPAGAAALADALAGLGDSRHPRVAVMSVLADKDLTHILAPLAPHIDMVIATRSHHDRARAPEDVAAGAAAAGLPARVEPDPVAALARARSAAGDDGLVVICGSLYLLVDLRSVAAADG
ncbi:MAG TPA: PLP-dependent transferase, partial [Miltoncostaeaceae bacterium]|nr:PLP-dependent transferase [Miltoncostaeaceae bacterium]